jgi:hypothetical protein
LSGVISVRARNDEVTVDPGSRKTATPIWHLGP